MKLDQEGIIKIIESVFKQSRGSIELETPLDDFAKDSMDVVEFIAILKNKHSVIIEPSEVAKLSNVKEIVDYILEHQ